ncbi:MAG: HlyD family type I secretion periplasmic adaptor subunit [Candidatus Midichloria sp.]|nr:HlyD family type I secretion periplasmic adaptor subunit [Candidatus Midichloria sp.]
MKNIDIKKQEQPETDGSSKIIEGVVEDKKEDKIHPIKTFFDNTKRFLIAKTAEEARYRKKIESKLVKQVKPAVIFGGIAIGICISFFVIWGGLAPLDSAAVAEGTIIVSGNHKTIQHLEGGIIEEIFVEEGQTINEGDNLIKLSDTSAKSTVQVMLSQLRFAKALEKRLIAEEQEDNKVDFNDPILDISDPEVEVLIKNQKALFDLNKKALRVQMDVYNQRILQKNEEINSHEARLEAITSRLAIAKEQFNITNDLYKKGLESKTRLLHFQERYEELEGEMHSVKAFIAKAREEICETDLHKVHAENDFKQKTAEKYRENHVHVLELEQKLQYAKDILERTMIKAPNAGMVTGLAYHTIGGVIQQGAKVMDIVPQDDKLIIEAYVLPQFIESLYVGLEAKVQLNAYKSRLVPRILGKVTYVSADKFVNQSNGQSFYTIKIELDEESMKSVNTDIKLYPGMPVTVFIVKGTRTFLQYMMSPIVDSFHKAFKEA